MSWKPPESLWEWHAPHDPEGGTYSGNLYTSRWAKMLRQAGPAAFGDVERQLSATAQLAEVTAQGLRGARDAHADLSGKRSEWGTALSSTYSDAQTGWAHLHRLQDDLRAICARGHSILMASVDALSDLQGRLQPSSTRRPRCTRATGRRSRTRSGSSWARSPGPGAR
ncbi:MAG TPA: hypothetical protein VHW96_07275 [Solirubrobacteraceae bacterium]|nr:hypothetical protein [Solirubrobacteraceae bacterium]